MAEREAGSVEGGIPRVRIFVSSPGDVAEERAVTLSVLKRLQGFFQGRLVLVPILWEQEPLLATAGFQQEIDRRAAPSATDVAVFVLWSRLGSPLSKDFVLEDGRRPTGTEWEFEDAVRGHREHDVPHLLVYRNNLEPKVGVGDAHLEKRRAEFETVQAFFEHHFQDATDLTFTGSYHTYEEVSEFGSALETHLAKLLSERLAGASAEATWHDAPFRGLESFEARHAPIFFGRTRAIQEVREVLARQVAAGRAFVLLLGRSGNGKSSLARAGIVPMLSGPWIVEADVEGGFCRRAILMPGAARTPVEALANALLQDEALPDLRASGDAAVLAALFAKSPEACVSHVRGALHRSAQRRREEKGLAEAPPPRLLLLVDQLEELFTKEGVGEEERQAFAALLDALARSGEVYVLATLRSDFYPAFSKLGTLMALKGRAGQYDLPPMDATETAQVVRGPAQVSGLVYETDLQEGRSLDEVLIAEATKGPDALPLLEYALTQLEEKKRGHLLTFEAYEAMGGLEGAIATRAEAEWAALPEEARWAFPSVLRALVEVGEGREKTATKRRAPREEVAATPGGRAFVERFVAARLLVASGDGEGAAVAVAHEALLRTWSRMADRIEDEADLLRIHGRVRTQAARWAEKGREASLLLAAGKPLEEARLLGAAGFDLTERERAFVESSERRARQTQRLKQAAVTAIGVLAIAALLLALFAFSKQREADKSAQSATRALDDVRRLADVKKVRDLEDEARRLSPIQPDLPDRLASWERRAEALAGRVPAHQAALERLRAQAEGPGPPWHFADEALAWQHQVLTDLVERLHRLADPRAPVPLRVASLHRMAEAAADPAWPATVARIRANPRYGGLVLAPQMGLVPLGADPDSGLDEFAHVGSGSVPGRDPETKRLAYQDESAIVLVLISGGTFRMGAQEEDPTGPNYDRLARDDESPVHRVTLSPFLLAKHECTQAQWKTLTGGKTPSSFREGKEAPRRPVDQVSWGDATKWLPVQGLRLPTEAEWEYACRAGTTTPWWTGADEGGLAAVAWYVPDAGWTTHPVGTKAANAWGLHDVYGNVYEWCEDAYGSYTKEAVMNPVVEEGDGSGYRVARGGSWVFTAETVRSAYRYGDVPGDRADHLGVRPARPVTAK